jgi:hypothetical protein
MAIWTPPRTWVPDEYVTDAEMNTHVRDNLAVLAGAYATTLAGLTALYGGEPPDGAQGVVANNHVVPVRKIGGSWYMQPFEIASQSTFVQHGAFGFGEIMRGFIPWHEFWLMGFTTLWLRFAGEVYSDQANAFANYRIISHWGEEGGALSEFEVYRSAINPSPTSEVYRDSGWQPIGHGDHTVVGGAVQVQADNTGQNTFGRGSLWAMLTATV